MDELFAIALSKPAFVVGERVTGAVRLTSPSDDRLQKAKKLTVQVLRRVHGSGDTEEATLFSVERTEGLLDGGAVSFDLVLPADGPVSWHGRYVKVEWKVVATLDVPWAKDPKRELVFQVVPRGA